MILELVLSPFSTEMETFTGLDDHRSSTVNGIFRENGYIYSYFINLTELVRKHLGRIYRLFRSDYRFVGHASRHPALPLPTAAEKECARKDLLLKLLNDGAHDWRELETHQHLIGADEATTKRLLIDIGAQASENGNPIWALIGKQLLPRKR